MDPSAVRDQLDEWFSIELFSSSSVTVGALAQFGLALVLAFIAGIFVRRLVARSLLRRRQLDAGVAYAISRGVQYAVVSAGVVVAFQYIGIDFSRLGLIFGLLSVGIGFGLQNVTANFISGLILLIERPVTVGDRVSIGDAEGEIEAIGIRSTLVRSLGNVAIIVPNSDLITNNVVNWSHGDPRIRLSIPVGVSYGSDAQTVREALLAVADRNPTVLRGPAPAVRLNAFGDSSRRWSCSSGCASLAAGATSAPTSTSPSSRSSARAASRSPSRSATSTSAPRASSAPPPSRPREPPTAPRSRRARPPHGLGRGHRGRARSRCVWALPQWVR